jgi:bidirectional [NiFe] hydrogenase diaphorase subunit
MQSVEITQTKSPEDKRWRLVNATMRKHGYASDALIETLHTVQGAFGFLDDETLKYVASNLKIAPSRVYGVATFYNHFTLKPQGKHTCVVCMGTACYIKGTAQVLSEIQTEVGLKPGETSAHGEVSLMVARCLGACGVAPACVFDGEVVGEISAAVAVEKIEEWIDHER